MGLSIDSVVSIVHKFLKIALLHDNGEEDKQKQRITAHIMHQESVNMFAAFRSHEVAVKMCIVIDAKGIVIVIT